ncbi:unnamed protein product, partial [Prorocentrum cordatum]
PAAQARRRAHMTRPAAAQMRRPAASSGAEAPGRLGAAPCPRRRSSHGFREESAASSDVLLRSGEAHPAPPLDGGLGAPGLEPPRVRGACSWTHWMNMLALLASAAVAYLDYSGVFGEGSAELGARYRTLVTPAPWTSCIWVVIYALEAVFAAAQLSFGGFRGSGLVEAVTQSWILTCACQILWFVLYSQELLAMALAISCVLATTLLLLLARADAEDMTPAEFWLLRVPFSVHAGWAVVLCGQNLNVVASMMLLPSDTLLALAYATLACTLSAVVFYQLVASRPDAVIAGVVVWALGGVWTELSDPNRLDSYGEQYAGQRWDR